MKSSLTTMLAGAVTVAAVATGTALTAAPASAIDLKFGDTLQMTGLVTVTNVGVDTFNVDFGTSFVLGSSPFTLGDLVTVTDLNNVVVGANVGPLAPFISGILLSDGITSEEVNFVLEQGILFNAPLLNTSGIQNIRGRFVNASNDVLGIGNLSLQFAGIGGLPVSGSQFGSFSSSIQVIPTPAAVLPGLLGMGAAAFRKKKQEDEGEVTLESADANA